MNLIGVSGGDCLVKIEDLQGIEATHLDYKVSLEKEKAKSWLKSVVAYANTKGGHILFGVTNEEHIPIGLDDAQSTASKIAELLTARVEPPVRYTPLCTISCEISCGVLSIIVFTDVAIS